MTDAENITMSNITSAITTGDIVSIVVEENSCDFCGQHGWESICPRSRCECGSVVTVLARDHGRDNKVFRRCWRCNELKVWDE